MIKHIVMWKLKETAEGATKAENAYKIKTLLEGLKDKIEVIQSIEVGINIEPSETAYDVVLYSEFEDEQGLEAYQIHPDHQEAGSFVKKVVTERVVVDYRA
ncbi:Dabb family protein [Caldalkalibacillus salinus]|uniref:Dabb family protein n=1 Tax=Caldalkalibacillus salinus TaxID=2803787 RepID=UPI0019248A1A|nr:Dabb family protein [Caldalkalibacillus salinus]